MTQDTEARRLAEQVLNEPKTYRDVLPLARAYLNLLTRLETPGLTDEAILAGVIAADSHDHAPGYYSTSDLGLGGHCADYVTSIYNAMRGRITQPTSTMSDDSDLDWTEDYARHGEYVCRCSVCKKTFNGHKRRVVCKRCASVEPPVTTAPAVDGGGG